MSEGKEREKERERKRGRGRERERERERGRERERERVREREGPTRERCSYQIISHTHTQPRRTSGYQMYASERLREAGGEGLNVTLIKEIPSLWTAMSNEEKEVRVKLTKALGPKTSSYCFLLLCIIIYGVPSVSKILANGIFVYLLQIYKYDSYLSNICVIYIH